MVLKRSRTKVKNFFHFIKFGVKYWETLGALENARKEKMGSDQSDKPKEIKKNYDLIIIGCGPAGAAAAVYAARQKLDFAIVTKDIGGMTNINPYPIDNYLGYHYVTGVELEQKFEEHLKLFNIPTIMEDVRKIQKTKDGFIITTDKYAYACLTVLVATGRINMPLKVPGELDFQGRGVSFCAHCDAPLFKDKVVVVVGGGRTGLDSALQLLNIAKKVFIIEKENRIKEEEPIAKFVKNNEKVEIITSAQVTEIFGDKVVKGIKFSKYNIEQTIAAEGVFINIGYVPNTQFVKNLVRMNDREEITINENNMTSTPGIFAAGDCTSVKEKQILVAAGEGAKALISASEFLHQKKGEFAKAKVPEKKVVEKKVVKK